MQVARISGSISRLKLTDITPCICAKKQAQVNIDNISPFSDLPSELIIRILHLAAATSRQACKSLCLVSSWARKVALPYLLSIVVLSDARHFLYFAGYVNYSVSHRTPSLERLGHHTSLIRRLWVPDLYRGADTSCEDNLVPRIVASCTNLTDLAITDVDLFALLEASTGTYDAPVKFHPKHTDLRLTIFGFHQKWCKLMVKYLAHPPPRRSPVFALVTELRFVEGLPQGTAGSTGGQPQLDRLNRCIDLFPRLVYFATPYIPLPGAAAMFESALARCSSGLQLFVLVLYEELWTALDGEFGRWLMAIRQRDSRVHFVASRRETIQKKWCKESHGRETLWERAVRQTSKWEAGV